jgi:hypothetical protein
MLRYKLSAVVLGILLVSGSLFFWRACKNSVVGIVKQTRIEKLSGIASVLVNPSRHVVTVKTKADKLESVRLPVHSTINIDEDDDELDVTFKNYGPIFSPGLGVGYSNGIFGGVDVQFFYWYDFGTHIGACYHKDGKLYIYGLISYNLRSLGLQNTYFAGGMKHDRTALLMLRWGF